MMYTAGYHRGDPSPVLASPEVFDEVPERVCPLGQRYDDIDEDAAHVHALALDLHHGPERPEERELRESPRAVFFKRQLIDCSPVPLCASQPWDRETQVTARTRALLSRCFIGLLCPYNLRRSLQGSRCVSS